jgi:ElaA protein
MTFVSKKFNELTLEELYEILKARCEVFAVEQQIICQDMDGVDYNSLHCFLKDNGKIVAYLRAFYMDEEPQTVKIGRVLTLTHGKGDGRRLMEESLKAIKEKMPCEGFCVHAQKYAAGYYGKFGFETVSDDFLEEGIIHVEMRTKV